MASKTIKDFILHLSELLRSAFAYTSSRDERGQSTAEYALLLLAAATIALIVVSWASGTGKIGELFDAVVDSIIGKV
jgi:Flp pilus assembly pilin Flp